MRSTARRRRSILRSRWMATACVCAAASASVYAQTPAPEQVQAQDASAAPASVPAGAQPAEPAGRSTATAVAAKPVPEKQAREADDAYLAGAKALERNDLPAAERDFSRAVQLNPTKPEYVLSLAVAREHRASSLVSQAALARRAGNDTYAEGLLAQARAIAPDSGMVSQHFLPAPDSPEPTEPAMVEAADPPGSGSRSRLGRGIGGGIELLPSVGLHSFHQTAPPEQLLRSVYTAFGIRTQFPDPVGANGTARLDLDDVDYATAARVVDKMLNVFTVPLQPDAALVVKNTQENRDQYEPLMEETLYTPGLSGDALSELANVARQVFDLKQVTASQTGGDMLVRGDARTLRLLNATYADMLDGGSDVQLDISLFEVDKSFIRNFGLQTPSSVGAFSVYGEVQSLLAANASTIQAAVASGALVLTGNPAVDIPKELIVLAATGALSSVTQLNNLLGTLGSFGGIPLAGVFLGSSPTFNLALNTTDVRTLDFAQLRASDRQAASFRAGTRYPVTTGTYSSGISSSTLSGLGLTAAQQAAAAAYLGTSGTTVSIPQFQYEDLGLTIKATPTVHQSKEVTLQLDMKIEALGGTSLNNVPILNSRALTSSITVSTGQTVLLASEVTKSEMRAINGVPGLSEIPGFQGTDKDTEKDSSELLITLTPHVVRLGHRDVSSRRLAFDHPANAQ